MARKRIQPKTSRPTWGTNNPVEIRRTRPDGTSYIEYRVAYRVEVLEDGDWLKKRRYASSSESPQEAIRLAAQRKAENEREVAAYWSKQRGETTVETNEGDERTHEDIPVSSDATLAEAAEQMMRVSRRWREGRQVELAHSYVRRVRRYIRILQDDGLGSKPMRALRSMEVQAWFNKVCKDYAASTAKNLRGWLISLGEFGLENDYWTRNLFKKTTKVTLDSTRQNRVLSLDEIDAIWNEAHTPQLKAALVLLRLGLRQGEVLALTEHDLIGEDTIKVNHNLTERPNPLYGSGRPAPKYENFLGRTKTARSRSEVHVPSEWMKVLRDSVALARPCLIADPSLELGQYAVRRFVVNNRFGQAWHEGSASAAMRNILKRAKVEMAKDEATWHCWRHSYASDIVALGADDIVLINLMRHADPTLSRGVYAHARDEYRDRYREYAAGIRKLSDYNDALCRFDEDRRQAERQDFE